MSKRLYLTKQYSKHMRSYHRMQCIIYYPVLDRHSIDPLDSYEIGLSNIYATTTITCSFRAATNTDT